MQPAVVQIDADERPGLILVSDLQLMALDTLDVGPCIVGDFAAAPAKVPGSVRDGSTDVL